MSITSCSGKRNCKSEAAIYALDPCGHLVCDDCRNTEVCALCDCAVSDVFKSASAEYFFRFVGGQIALQNKKRGRPFKKKRGRQVSALKSGEEAGIGRSRHQNNISAPAQYPSFSTSTPVASLPPGTRSLSPLSVKDMSLCSLSGEQTKQQCHSTSQVGAESEDAVIDNNFMDEQFQKSPAQAVRLDTPLSDTADPSGREPQNPCDKIILPSFPLPDQFSLGASKYADCRLDWNGGVALFSNLFCLLKNRWPVKTLTRMAFDVLCDHHKLFDRAINPVSPLTESEIKAAESDLFRENSTIKVALGQEPVKRSSFTRRQLTFAKNRSTPPMESEDIVEGTPIKPAPKRVDLLNESLCSPLSVVSEEIPDETDAEHPSTIIIEDSEEPQRKRKRLRLVYNQGAVEKINHTSQDVSRAQPPVLATSGIYDSRKAQAIRQLILLINAQISKDKSELSRQTTHLIVQESNGCSATPKLLKAIYYGMHVVIFDWVMDCLKEQKMLPESPYYPEACPGVARRMAYPKDHKLFQNFVFYLSADLGSNFGTVKEFADFCEVETVPEPKIDPDRNCKTLVCLHGTDHIDLTAYDSKTTIHQSVCWFLSCVFSYQVSPFI